MATAAGPLSAILTIPSLALSCSAALLWTRIDLFRTKPGEVVGVGAGLDGFSQRDGRQKRRLKAPAEGDEHGVLGEQLEIHVGLAAT